ncbi:MAG: hypothetical protein ACKOE4_06415 [Candidatus Kapaibacterium sp.]
MSGVDREIIALVMYSLTMSLGIAARYRSASFGRWHHALYAITCIVTMLSLIGEPQLAHVPCVIVLALLPATRPRTSRRHDLLAIAGLASFILLVLPS